jgi:hypothetical protein
MIEPTRKKAILDAEKEFERKELLSRALAEKGAITSPVPVPVEREAVSERECPITPTDPRPVP